MKGDFSIDELMFCFINRSEESSVYRWFGEVYFLKADL